MTKNSKLRSFKEFINTSTGAGVLLITCVTLSLLLANSFIGNSIISFFDKEIGFNIKSLQLKYSIKQWIDDGLMTVFFLLVGLEIKKELVSGQLSSPKQAALPIIAAFGGAILPAIIYSIINHDQATHNGWGIPMATDIAFALAVISMLGDRVPFSLKVFIAALAIIDDLLAIVVIALFYSTELHYDFLIYALCIFILQLTLNKLGVKNILAYVIPGAFMWYFIHHSGIHATIAGVLTAITTPTDANSNESPLVKLEHILTTPVNYFIIPLFAFANTMIIFTIDMFTGLTSPLGLGIILGLLLGKSLGITFTCWASVKLGIATLPEKASWKHMFGVGIVAGIGFTMSIFISMLSFKEAQLFVEEAKLAILLTSILAGTIGYIYLSYLNKSTK